MQILTVQELQDWARQTPAALLLDVREPWEVALARIDVPGLAGVHMPMGDIPSDLQRLDPEQPIAVYCHHGVRSLQVVAFLARHGFDVVYNLAGGIDAWSREIDPSVPRY
ncbi:rhodanese-like domain-containing protein [Roseateles sp. SL47]|uniref:rhodanese-like domain-containing protein n=1 Tax=Roseateles sp. SL47 TaxID=2995138 RepID=UPI00226EBA8F|nr:rhodanese-like domain-containing protein [Roseateles sp. SL47]WAC72122.1 rhodanese-like domain-containing protein [Roseateles sp. SL47]